MTRAEIGAALDRLASDTQNQAADLLNQYRRWGHVGVLKQAIDTPRRMRSQLDAWIADYEQRNGANTAQQFLQSCLVAAGSQRSLASVRQALAALETTASGIVSQQASGASWDAVAAAAEQAFPHAAEEQFDLTRMPVAKTYRTAWGEQW